MDDKHESGRKIHLEVNNRLVVRPVNKRTVDMNSDLDSNSSTSPHTNNEETISTIGSVAPTIKRKNLRLTFLSMFILISVAGATSYLLQKDPSNNRDNTQSISMVNEFNNDTQSIISRLVLVDFERYSAMSVSDRDQIRQDIGDLWRLAIDTVFLEAPDADDIGDAADDLYGKYYSGSSSTYRNMFAAGAFTSGGALIAGACPDVGSDEFRVIYDEKLGALGTLYVCLESGDVYTAEK